MNIELKLKGLDGVLETLKSLPPEVVSKRGGPVLSALRKGARVILKQEQSTLRTITANATVTGKRESTGLLLKSLTTKRGKAPAGGNGERVLITTKRLMYPGRKGEQVSVRKTGQLLEYGSHKQPAESWVRTAFAAKAREAVATTETELVKGIDKLVKKLAAKNQGK